MLTHTRIVTLLSAATLIPSGLWAQTQGPLPFAEAVFTDVVNDVQVVSQAAATPVKAVKNSRFAAPDLVKTGRKSRAQLTAADGTVARIGSNSVFSFDKSSRTMNLEKGSVLFHSPTGKGGGTVVTNSATASVVGTTIIVAATADGGFKMLVLEGVAKVTFPDGLVKTINAGQMTFVLPGSKVGGERGGVPGPVLNFDLAAMSEDSALLNGFTTSLASFPKILFEVEHQGSEIEDGELVKTGLYIVGAEDSDEFIVTDRDAVQQAIQAASSTEQDRLNSSLSASLVYDGTTPIPEDNIFRTGVFIPQSALPSGVTAPTSPVFGVLVGHLELNTSVFDLGFIDGVNNELTVAGLSTSTVKIPGDITFQGLATSRIFRLVGGRMEIANGAKVAVDFSNVTSGAPTEAEFISLTGADFTGVSFLNASGSFSLSTVTGNLVLSNVTARAGSANGPSTANLDIFSGAGLTINSGDYRASGGASFQSAASTTISGGVFDAASVQIQSASNVGIGGGTVVTSTGGISIVGTGGAVTLNGASFTSQGGVSVASAGDITVLTGTSLSGFAGVNLSALGGLNLSGPITSSAGTVNLSGFGRVQISGGATVLAQGALNVNSNSENVEIGTAVLKSQTGALSLVAVGNIALPSTSTASAAQNLILDAGGTLAVGTSLTSSGGSIFLSGAKGLGLSNPISIDAFGDITANASAGSVDLGVAALKALNGGVSVQAANNVSMGVASGRSIDANKDVFVNAGGLLQIDGGITSTIGGVSLQATGNVTLANTSFVSVSKHLFVKSTSGNVSFGASSFISGGGGLTAIAGGNLALASGGTLSAVNAVDISAGGLLTLNGDVTSVAGPVFLSGVNGVTIATGALMMADQNLNITSGSNAVTVGDTALTATNGPLSLNAQRDVTLGASTGATLTGGAGVTINSGGTLTLLGTVNSATGGASLSGTTNVVLVGASSVNATRNIQVSSSGGVDLGAATLQSLSGSVQVSSVDNMALASGGFVSGDQFVTLNAGRALSIAGDLASLSGSVTLSGAEGVNLAANVTVNANLNINITSSGKDITLGDWVALNAQQSIGLNSTTDLINIGDATVTAINGTIAITAAKDVTLGATSGISLNAGSHVTVTAGGNLDIFGSITSLDSSATGGGNVFLSGKSLTVGVGRLSAWADLNLEVQDALTITGSGSTQRVSLDATNINLRGKPSFTPSLISLLNVDLFGGTVTAIGQTVSLESVGLQSGTTVTLRSQSGGFFDRNSRNGVQPAQTGKVNVLDVTLAGLALASGDVWSPIDNLGDVESPIHVLDLTSADFRGTKKAYAVTHDLTYSGSVVSSGIANSHVFGDVSSTSITLDNADFGLLATEVVPSVDYNMLEVSHSALQVNGVLARKFVLNNASIDLSRFEGTNDFHVDLVATDTFQWAGVLTIGGMTNNRVFEIRAKQFNIASGAALDRQLAVDTTMGQESSAITLASLTSLNLPNFTLKNDHGTARFWALTGNLTVNGSLLTAGTTGGAFGDLELSSRDGLVQVASGSTLSATVSIDINSDNSGVKVETGATLAASGSVSLNASNGAISVNSSGTSISGDFGVNMNAGGDITLDTTSVVKAGFEIPNVSHGVGSISMSSGTKITVQGGASVFVEGDAFGSSVVGSLNLAAPEVVLDNASLKVQDTANGGIPAGFLKIQSSVAVRINGGHLEASKIDIKGDGVTTLDSVEIQNNPTFITSANAFAGIAVEANTIKISDVNFPSATEIRLRTKDGVLNLGTTARVNAVNFLKNVGVNGAQIVDASGAPNATNLASLVWIENNTASDRVYVNNGANPDTSLITNASSANAPIHVQGLGSADQPGVQMPR